MAFLFAAPGGMVKAPVDVATNHIFDGGGSIYLRCKPTTRGGGGVGRLISVEDSAGSGGWAVYTEGGAGKDHFVFRTDHATTDGLWTTPEDSAPLGVETELAISYDKDAPTVAPVIHVNGQPVTVTTVTTPAGVESGHATKNVMFGAMSDFSNDFDGEISHVRFYDGVLTQPMLEDISISRGRDDGLLCGELGLVLSYPMAPHVDGVAVGTGFMGMTEASGNAATTLEVNVPPHKKGDLLLLIAAAGGPSFGGSTPPATFVALSGWSQAFTFTMIETASTPSANVWMRPATDSEPASYTFEVSDVCPLKAYMIAVRGPTDSVVGSGSQTAASGNAPTAPSITPTEPALILFLMLHDGTGRADADTAEMYPEEVRGGFNDESAATPGNGCGILFGLYSWDGSATGTRIGSFIGSEQNGGAHVAFAWPNGGRDVPPCYDISPNAAHAETLGMVTAVSDASERGI